MPLSRLPLHPCRIVLQEDGPVSRLRGRQLGQEAAQRRTVACPKRGHNLRRGGRSGRGRTGSMSQVLRPPHQAVEGVEGGGLPERSNRRNPRPNKEGPRGGVFATSSMNADDKTQTVSRR